MAAMNTADIGFEKEIWKAADKMRGNIDASEYKSVVLGLIFLKYISDKFEAKYQQLVAEGEGFEEDKDEYLSNKNEKGSYDPVFYVPAEARWEAIAIHAHSPEIGTIIDNAMRAIEKENKRLKDILPKNFARPELDKRRLGEVVDLFTNIRMHEHGDSKDILGRAYEYCLSKFAEAEGKLAGEFYTPACIVKTLVNVLQPYKGRVYDPCCGSGGMFVQSAQFIENHSGNINNISVYGQDSNPTTWKMAQMNLAIRGIEADLGRYNADTFFNDCHPTLKADFVMANPPFNLSDWGADKLADDVRWKYGTPPNGNANFAWIQHIIHHLAPTGRAGVVLANGSLSSQSGGEGEIEHRQDTALLCCCQVGLDLLRRQDFHFVLQDFGWNAVICRVSEDQALFDRAVERVVQHRVDAANRGITQPRLLSFLRFAEPSVFPQVLVQPLQIASGQLFERNIANTRRDMQFDAAPVVFGSRESQVWLCV